MQVPVLYALITELYPLYHFCPPPIYASGFSIHALQRLSVGHLFSILHHQNGKHPLQYAWRCHCLKLPSQDNPRLFGIAFLLQVSNHSSFNSFTISISLDKEEFTWGRDKVQSFPASRASRRTDSKLFISIKRDVLTDNPRTVHKHRRIVCLTTLYFVYGRKQTERLCHCGHFLKGLKSPSINQVLIEVTLFCPG